MWYQSLLAYRLGGDLLLTEAAGMARTAARGPARAHFGWLRPWRGRDRARKQREGFYGWQSPVRSGSTRLRRTAAAHSVLPAAARSTAARLLDRRACSEAFTQATGPARGATRLKQVLLEPT